MADACTDRRIVRTKVVIREALIDLIEEKGFDAVSVKDITTRANINRGTFYLHYRDKFDLLEQTVAEITGALETFIKRAHTANCADVQEIDEPFRVLVLVFEYLSNNKSLIHAVIGPKGNFAFQTKMKKAMWSNIFEKEFSAHVKREKLLVPSEYLISYVASANFGVIRQWLQGGCKESPQEMASILAKLTVGGPLLAAGMTIP